MQINITKCLVFIAPLFGVLGLSTSIWMDLKKETEKFSTYQMVRGKISGKECANHGYISAEYRISGSTFSGPPKLLYAKPNCNSAVVGDSINLWISNLDHSFYSFKSPSVLSSDIQDELWHMPLAYLFICFCLIGFSFIRPIENHILVTNKGRWSIVRINKRLFLPE